LILFSRAPSKENEGGIMTKQFFLATIIALSSVLGSSATAQGPPSDSPGSSPKARALEDKYRSDEIERVRREAEVREYRPSARFPQIKEDFERIQIINSEQLQVRASTPRLDFERIAKAATEIRTRATRLKSDLFPSASKEPKKQVDRTNQARDDLKFLLAELDKAIIIFVHNPIFENTKVVNPQDSTRAERELWNIINLSERTRKRAERRDVRQKT
jgi:hypothetical protein